MTPRILVLITILALGAPALFPAAAAQDDGPSFADTALDAFVLLKSKALGLTEDPRSPTAILETEVVPHSTTSTDGLVQAWRDAENARGADARASIVRAEAALLGFANENAVAAKAGDEGRMANEWLSILAGRVDGAGRGMDVARAASDEESFREAARALVAIRAREETVQAIMLARAGRAADADVAAQGAEALIALLLPAAREDLPTTLMNVFVENATSVREAIADLPPERNDHALSGLLAPLVALEYDHAPEVVEEFAVRNSDAAFLTVRAAREDPALFDVLAIEAFTQYGADRGGLFLRGEGTMDATDAAYLTFKEAAASSDAARLAPAAAAIHVELAKVGVLGRGIVLKVETGGVQPGREHEYRVTLVRPPLEGIRSYRVSIAYDPAVVNITRVTPVELGEDFKETHSPGNATFEGRATDPVRANNHLARFTIVSTGEPETRTNLTITVSEFLEPDGDRAGVLLLRHGTATVANIVRGDDDEEAEGAAVGGDANRTPLGIAPVLLAGLAAAGVRRRLTRQ